MATKFTAAQLRGLKVEHEKEIRDNAIKNICSLIKDKCIEYAKKGDTKCVVYIIRNPGDNHLTLSWNKYQSVQILGICTEDMISDCIALLTSDLVDCVIDGEMEEIPYDRVKVRHKFTITVDWSEQNSEEKAEEKPEEKEENELDILRAKITELEAENARLKAPSTVGAITNDLIDIFANFGKIN